jgi:predicted nucleic acid-binding protein
MDSVGNERTFTMSKVFLDTNILVYSLDRSDPDKQNRCRQLIKSLTTENIGVISTQVMQEFYVASTTKLGADPLIVKDILRSLQRFETVIINPTLIKEAVDCSIINRISFWDALIIAAAESAKCKLLWTEDLNHGQIVRGVRIEDPLKPTEI